MKGDKKGPRKLTPEEHATLDHLAMAAKLRRGQALKGEVKEKMKTGGPGGGGGGRDAVGGGGGDENDLAKRLWPVMNKIVAAMSSHFRGTNGDHCRGDVVPDAWMSAIETYDISKGHFLPYLRYWLYTYAKNHYRRCIWVSFWVRIGLSINKDLDSDESEIADIISQHLAELTPTEERLEQAERVDAFYRQLLAELSERDLFIYALWFKDDRPAKVIATYVPPLTDTEVFQVIARIRRIAARYGAELKAREE